MKPDVYRMGWEEVTMRLDRLLPPRGGLIYGVPRGGAILAGMAHARSAKWKAVGQLGVATLILDDIVDSGKTRERFTRTWPGKPFLALVDKTTREDRRLGWVAFPWEDPDPTKDNEDLVVRLLELLGQDPKREGLRETPRRFLKAMTELTEGYQANTKAILGTVFEEPYDEMVLVRGIPFWSLCEHHLLPFQGRATVGYVPRGRVVGLSKLARLVQAHARRLQVQERMTQDIAQDIQAHLRPQGVGVLVEATHTCMAMRGVRSEARMVTSKVMGCMRKQEARSEFMALAKGR